jgi:hypothetical protein
VPVGDVDVEAFARKVRSSTASASSSLGASLFKALSCGFAWDTVNEKA